ncbi:MAG: phasin family protein [Hyphomicrobium sp.]
MIHSFDDMQSFNRTSLAEALRFWSSMQRDWQAITAATGDFTTATFEEGAAALVQILHAGSLETAFEIQANFAAQAAERYFRHVDACSQLTARLAGDALRPVDTLATWH